MDRVKKRQRAERLIDNQAPYPSHLKTKILKDLLHKIYLGGISRSIIVLCRKIFLAVQRNTYT